MKLIKVKNNLTIIFEDDSTIMTDQCDEKAWKFVTENMENPEKIMDYFTPKSTATKEIIKLKDDVDTSSVLKREGDKVIIKSVSKVSLPKHLIDKITEAEKAGDKELVGTYLNFWKLACQNPNEQSRQNLLWFLDKHGFTILKSGIFVAYRNVVTKKSSYSKKDKDFLLSEYDKIKRYKKSPKNYRVYQNGKDKSLKVIESKKVKTAIPDTKLLGDLNTVVKNLHTGEEVYTDAYTKTMTIKIGTPVSMEREKCDHNSNNECSSGLHASHKNWDSLGSFGDATLRILINPRDVVAVPTNGGYHKMRVCQYYPSKKVARVNGVITDDIKDGEELNYIEMISSALNEADSSPYVFDFPSDAKGISSKELHKLSLTIDEIKAELKKRIK